MSSKILLLSVLVISALANVHLNIKYRSFLDGAHAFEELVAKEIYSQFRSPYTEKSEFRFKIFRETLLEIRNHNMGKHSWKQGLNDFSDMTFEEFSAGRLMKPQECSATNRFKVSQASKSAIPAEYEWNNYGMVSPVKNQGSCGSCWTFSTVGSL